MIIKKAELLITAAKKEQYPETIVPEIAFAGKSNVGKSSMINALVNRKSLARTSSSPGKTQTVNFYNVNDTLNLVDLPGYGYAKVSKQSKENWGKMIETFLTVRHQLKEVVLLVDIRHEPGENDVMMYDWIKSCGYTGYVIATKADKISKGQRARYVSIVMKKLGIQDKNLVLTFSASEKLNVEGAWELIENIIAE